jgi:CRISPR-associated protein Cas4
VPSLTKILLFLVDLFFLNLAIYVSYLTRFSIAEDTNRVYLVIYSSLAWLFLALVSNPYGITKNWSLSKITKNQFVFLLIHSPEDPLSGIFFVSVRSHGLQLIVLVAATLLVIRSFMKAARTRHRDSGFALSQLAVAIEGSSILPSREYISSAQGLAGKPDALVKEEEFFLPVERKPLAKKLRDRYVAQLLVYMRLVEEFEGAKPPHGYLLLGPKCRRVKVQNSPQKQQWVDSMIREMRLILDGSEATAQPHPSKCAKCDVRHRCPSRGDSSPH